MILNDIRVNIYETFPRVINLLLLYIYDPLVHFFFALYKANVAPTVAMKLVCIFTARENIAFICIEMLRMIK